MEMQFRLNVKFSFNNYISYSAIFLNFEDEAWRFLSFIIFTILTNFLLFYSPCFSRCHSAFFKCFMSNSEAYAEPHTKPLFNPRELRVDCSNTIMLSYCKYSLLFLPVDWVDPATSGWVRHETLKKAEGHIGRNVVSITIKMRSIVRIV